MLRRIHMYIIFTSLKINMSPENQWLEDVFPTEIVPFRGHVSFPGCIYTHIFV